MKYLILAALLLSLNVQAANYNAPWYLAYIVDGGSITKYMGPYDSKYDCKAAKYDMPYRATFVGCYQ